MNRSNKTIKERNYNKFNALAAPLNDDAARSRQRTRDGSNGNSNTNQPAATGKPIYIDLLEIELAQLINMMEEIENPRDCEIWEESYSWTDFSDDTSSLGMFGKWLIALFYICLFLT